MKSLDEVLQGIEAFVKDMKELGVPVSVTVEEVPVIGGPEAVINLRALVREELKALEAEG